MTSPPAAPSGRAVNALSASLDSLPAAERVGPQALDTERALLGTALHNGGAIDQARDYLQPADFADDVHRHLFAVMCQRREAGEAIDLGLMKATLGDADLGGVTVGQYLVELMRGATTLTHVKDYCLTIARAAQMRKVVETAQIGLAAMTDGAVYDPVPTAVSMIEALDEVASTGLAEHARRITLHQSAAGVLERVNRAMQGHVPRGAPYGLPRLDGATLGMRPSQFIVLAARPAMGKTTVGLHFGLTAARASGPVAFFSLEMDAPELTERVLSALAYDPRARDALTYRSIADARDMSPEGMWRLQEAEKACAGIPLWIEPQAGLTLAQIAARSRQMKLRAERQGRKLAAIIVDHIGLIRPSKRYAGNRVQEMTEITTGLKGLAKELAIPVVGLSQLNREVEKRQDKRPQLSDLRESGSIEQDADVVIGLFRESYYLERQTSRTDEEEIRLMNCQNELEVEILKQRSGPTMRITCFCDIACNVIAEAAR